MHVIIHLSKLMECTVIRLNPNKIYGFGVITMFQCRFIDCSQRTTQGRGGILIMRVYRESIPSTQFCCEPKAALKK